LQTTRAEELALFMDDYDKYSQLHKSLMSATDGEGMTGVAFKKAVAEISNMAEILIARYINIGSSRELNISDERRKAIFETYEKDNPRSDLFELVVMDITLQLRGLFEDFVRADLFDVFIIKLCSTPITPLNVHAQPVVIKPINILTAPQEVLSPRKWLPWRSEKGTETPPIESSSLEDREEMVKNLFEEVQKKSATIKSKDAIIEELRSQLEKERSINQRIIEPSEPSDVSQPAKSYPQRIPTFYKKPVKIAFSPPIDGQLPQLYIRERATNVRVSTLKYDHNF
jgi:hypothetical protein